MAPHGNCRVCGAPAPGNMPCRRCCLLLLDRDNERADTAIRQKAGLELERIVKGAE